MRIALILFAILTMGALAVVAVIDTGTTPVSAGGGGQPRAPECGDDGDEGDGDPIDDPDSGDYTGSDDDDDDYLGEDSEDGDFIIEPDDCITATPEPTPDPGYASCGAKTAPGAYLYTDTNYGGNCIYVYQEIGFFVFNFEGQDWNDVVSSIDLVGIPYVRVCLHVFADGFCEEYMADVPDLGATGGLNDNLSSVYFTAAVSVDPPIEETAAPTAAPTVDATASLAQADVDCDESISTTDALGIMRSLGGASGNGCQSVGSEASRGLVGDADCSGHVNAGDAIAVLLYAGGLADNIC